MDIKIVTFDIDPERNKIKLKITILNFQSKIKNLKT